LARPSVRLSRTVDSPIVLHRRHLLKFQLQGPPAGQTLLVHFQAEIGNKLTHSTVSQIDKKIPVGATWEHRPRNFLAVGPISPIACTESVPSLCASQHIDLRVKKVILTVLFRCLFSFHYSVTKFQKPDNVLNLQ